MTPPYEIISVRDVSHHAAKRQAANVLISPGDMGHARDVLLKVVSIIRMPGITCTDDQGNHSRKWHYADIAWVFLWDDPAAVETTGAVARAMFVHKDLARQFIPPFPATEEVTIKGGIVKLVGVQK